MLYKVPTQVGVIQGQRLLIDRLADGLVTFVRGLVDVLWFSTRSICRCLAVLWVVMTVGLGLYIFVSMVGIFVDPSDEAIEAVVAAAGSGVGVWVVATVAVLPVMPLFQWVPEWVPRSER